MLTKGGCLTPQILLNIWAICGPLMGILLGSWLTTKNQRRHWILDNKRDEYRELLTTIADAGSNLLVHFGVNPIVMSGDEEFRTGEIARKSVDVMYNRLFIAKTVADLGIMKRWEDAIRVLQKTHDVRNFSKLMDGIMHDVRRAATRELD
jgi:hypothetical protein